jgi:signal transduction histidine kinase
MRPLDPLSSIKVKLGVVIVAAVAVTIVTVALGVRAGFPLLVCGLAAGVFALGMVQFLAHGMTSPLREMARAARSMAKGDYSTRVRASSRDEVGELARVFNQMAAELAEVDRMRRDLVANVSHELRTPISALQAMLENVVDGIDEPDPDRLRTMLAQVERLGRLVSQLLDLSKLESGGVPLQLERFEILPLLERATGEARLHAEQANRRTVAISAAADSRLSLVADPERIHQVVANLLDNAVRHSPAGGKVMASARAVDEFIVIEVTDEGPGIPAGDEARVFERFYRADGARSTRSGGTGLGLAIARWIVDLHGGAIRAEGLVPSGCRIVVELPRNAP